MVSYKIAHSTLPVAAARLAALLAALLSPVLTLSAPPAVAGARSLAAEPISGPDYAAPPIQIQTPAASTGSRKIRSQSAPAGPITLKSSNRLSLPELGAAACAPDPLRASSPSGAGAASQVERLRQTASGKLAPENQQLPALRQQQLQANAAWQMGLLTLHGICTVLNTADAAAWFERAQQLGEPLAPAGLAWCEIEGCKTAANPAAARKWLELLRSVDAPRALYLQWLMQSRLSPVALAQPGVGAASAAKAPVQNRQMLTSAAQQGDTNAKIELGLDSVLLEDLPAALAFFRSAAGRSAAASVNADVIAQRIKDAKRTPPPVSAGRTGNGIAVKSQSATDNLAQAQRYHRGQGVPANYTEAIRLYQLAQNQGDAVAKKMLELIFSRPAPDGNIDLAWMQQLAQVDVSSPSPTIDQGSTKQQLKREPTPLFDLVPVKWRRYALPTIGS